MSASDGRFSGKVAIITGGGSGIGRETALAFAREGARVLVFGRTEARLRDTVDLIAQGGGTARHAVGDVGNATDVQRMVNDAAVYFGRLDILFNNAGFDGDAAQLGKRLSDTSDDFLDMLLDINVKGVWLGMKYAIPLMLQNGGGCIVNNASLAGLIGLRFFAAYTATKHAVVGMTRTAAIEYAADGIRVNAVCMGAHETPMTAVNRKKVGEAVWDARIRSAYPGTGRMGLAREVSDVVLFLCSDAASNVHGTAIALDGGFSAQ